MLFYPCITNPKTGHIDKRLTDKPMTREQAERYLQKHVPASWLNASAKAQSDTKFNEVQS